MFCILAWILLVWFSVRCQCFDLIKRHYQNFWLWHKSQLEWHQYQHVICRHCGMDGTGSHSWWTMFRKDWHLVTTLWRWLLLHICSVNSNSDRNHYMVLLHSSLDDLVPETDTLSACSFSWTPQMSWNKNMITWSDAVKHIVSTIYTKSLLPWSVFIFYIHLTQVFPSVLRHCWLGDRNGNWPVKNWVLVCWWCHFDWSFARLITPLLPPHPPSLAPIKSRIETLWFRLTQIHLDNGH